MLWALVGIQRYSSGTPVSTVLAVPYFYQELDPDRVPGDGSWNHKRLSYQHSTLKFPEEQLKLVNLLPTNDKSSELRARIEVLDNIQKATYEVVTYIWNSTKQPAILRIDGMPHDIPTGLAHVLRRLRGNTPNATALRIDAVSIDQRTQREKDIMIPRMPDIFRFAKTHAIFADTTARDTDNEAIELLQRLDDMLNEPTRSTLEKEAALHDLVSSKSVETLLRSLLDRRIWTRIWPLQEIVLSANSTIFYGEYQISIKVLECVLMQYKMLEYAIHTTHKPGCSASDLSKNHVWRSVVEMACTRAAIQAGHNVYFLRALYTSR